MERHLVGNGRLVAAALLCSDVDDDRPVEVAQRAPEHAVERAQVVAWHGPDIRDAQILEKLAGLGEGQDG